MGRPVAWPVKYFGWSAAPWLLRNCIYHKLGHRATCIPPFRVGGQWFPTWSLPPRNFFWIFSALCPWTRLFRTIRPDVDICTSNSEKNFELIVAFPHNRHARHEKRFLCGSTTTLTKSVFRWNFARGKNPTGASARPTWFRWQQMSSAPK